MKKYFNDIKQTLCPHIKTFTCEKTDDDGNKLEYIICKWCNKKLALKVFKKPIVENIKIETTVNIEGEDEEMTDLVDLYGNIYDLQNELKTFKKAYEHLNEDDKKTISEEIKDDFDIKIYNMEVQLKNLRKDIKKSMRK